MRTIYEDINSESSEISEEELQKIRKRTFNSELLNLVSRVTSDEHDESESLLKRMHELFYKSLNIENCGVISKEYSFFQNGDIVFSESVKKKVLSEVNAKRGEESDMLSRDNYQKLLKTYNDLVKKESHKIYTLKNCKEITIDEFLILKYAYERLSSLMENSEIIFLKKNMLLLGIAPFDLDKFTSFSNDFLSSNGELFQIDEIGRKQSLFSLLVF